MKAAYFHAFLVVVCLLVGASSVAAQTSAHPCDVMTQQTTPTKGVKVQWCHDLSDGAGGVEAVGFKLYINGSLAVDYGVVAPLPGGKSTGGLYAFEAPMPAGYAKGVYDVQMVAYNTESAVPSPIAQWQVGGPPNSTTRPRFK